MKMEFSQQNFEKDSYINFNENPSSGSRVVLCGQKDRQTDMTKFTVAFRDFANASNKYKLCTSSEVPISSVLV